MERRGEEREGRKEWADGISVGIQISEGGEDPRQMIATLGFHLRFPSFPQSFSSFRRGGLATRGLIFFGKKHREALFILYILPLPLSPLPFLGFLFSWEESNMTMFLSTQFILL
jgi:hypothetical protein